MMRCLEMIWLVVSETVDVPEKRAETREETGDKMRAERGRGTAKLPAAVL